MGVSIKALLSKMGLATLFDPSTGNQGNFHHFAGIHHFPLARATHIHHQSVINVSVEDNPRSRAILDGNGEHRRHEPQEETEFLATSELLNVIEAKDGESSRSNKMTKHFKHNLSKRLEIDLDQRDFVYFILDNISGLMLTVGVYRH